MVVVTAVWQALQMAVFMFWEVLWPLTLGFLISAVVEALVPLQAITRVLGRDDFRGVTAATLLGAASSSCSYCCTLRASLAEATGAHAEKGLRGRMEGHADMDPSVTGSSFLTRLLSARGFAAISHNFYMDVTSLAQDLVLGFLIAGALAAWVPGSFWQTVFLTHNPTLGAVWGPIVGPIISLLSFVCSVGNVPLAVVLWNGGISFGGVISFIFADLIIIPILDIYRKYYGLRTSLYLLGASYLAIVIAGLAIGGLFQLFGLAPAHHVIAVFQTRPSWNYTTFLDFIFLAVALLLGWRFLRTGGLQMLRAMEHPAETHNSAHAAHHHH